MDVREDLDELRFRCALSTKMWNHIYGGLQAVTFSQRGEAAAHELAFKHLTTHQGGFYLQGLRKLGIDKDPPAVAAAKYHYFTNLIGGLDMEYIEESPKKVWIRYRAPMWTFPGSALLAMPSRLRRTIMGSWHPRNGKYMGCPRLQWVATKFTMEGDPYDEGYFIEHDEPVDPEHIVSYETVQSSPEYDPAAAPALDPQLWPEARMIKAGRNFSGEYVRATTETLYSMFGELATTAIVRETARGLAIQYLPEYQRLAGVDGSSFEAVVGFWDRTLHAGFQDYDSERVDEQTHRFHLRTFRPYQIASEELRRAWFELQVYGTRMISGRVSARRQPTEFGETWEFRDEGRWLW